MEVDDEYKSTLDDILNRIPKYFIDKGPYSKRLYNIINSGFNYYDRTNSNNMKLTVLTGKNIEMKAAGPYFPEDVQKHVKQHIHKQLHYTYYFPGDKIVEIYFGLLDEHIVNYQKYHDMMRLIISWAHVCMKYAYKECSKRHKVYFYLSDIKKVLPENQIMTLDYTNINTGVTTRCQPQNETIIYRKEEWFKVYIHEMMHAFGFDISDTYRGMISKEIKKLFHIKSSMKVEEAYVEVWARIINGAYAAYDAAENSDDFEKLFLFTMEVERLFSVMQAQKVLGYMNLTYDMVITPGSRIAYNLYREKTNVFAYFVLTAILMNNPYDFMKLCGKMNKRWIRFDNTIKAVKELESYIKNNYKNKDFLENIQTNYHLHNRGLRMTLIEVN